MNELSLCLILSNHLTQQGYSVYHEVVAPRGRIDLLAIKHGLQWAIEVKCCSGQDVIRQAIRWTKHCHQSSIATPNYPGMEMRQYCRDYGVEILMIKDGLVAEVRRPKFLSDAPTIPIPF